MAKKFKIGDRVQSKGIAGPVMLVNSMSSEYVDTFWFSGKKKDHGRFHEDTLELAPDASEKP